RRRGRRGAGGGRRGGARRRGRRTATGVDHISLAVGEREPRGAARRAVLDAFVDDVVVRVVPVRAVGDDARLASAHRWPVRRRVREGDGASCSRTRGQAAAHGLIAELATLDDDVDAGGTAGTRFGAEQGRRPNDLRGDRYTAPHGV